MENTDDIFVKNGFMFIYARQNIPAAEKIEKLQKILQDGAYINFPDKNDNDNTILHIATKREEKDVVEFLLRKGALLMSNLDNKTPLQIAKDKNTEVSTEILNILTKKGKHSPRTDVTCSRNPQNESNLNRSISLNTEPVTPANMYRKRKSTSGVSGQFYETKLLSLILHRALHDKVIEECYLAANMADIGNFDDVCFRFKMQEDGKTKHVMCFTQAKHREDPNSNRLTVEKLESTTEKFYLPKYFDSFLKIKQKFIKKNSETSDPMFEGKFDDIDCYFILYTPLKEAFKRKLTGDKERVVCPKLNDFINTGGNKNDVFQFDYKIGEINSVTIFIQQERIKALGEHLLSYILSGDTTQIMNNELIKIYHPALAQNVLELKCSESNYIEGKFRKEFFESDDGLLLTLKETLYNFIVMKQTKKTELTKEVVKEKVRDIVNNPCAQTISTLIGQVILFDDKSNKLYLDDQKITKKYNSEDKRQINHFLQNCQVTQALVNDAINIMGKEKLKSLTFKLPRTFGNLDFPFDSKTVKKANKEDRRVFLARKFYNLINEAKEESSNNNENGIVEICICDKNVGVKKTLELHLLTDIFGISGTVGNLLQFDEETKTFKFNTNYESLGINSNYMLREIQKLTQDDLSRYKITVKMNNFPRTSFEVNENDKDLAAEFLDKLWFYSNQASEETVESILKTEIDYHYNVDKGQNQFLFRVHSDAIFLRYHDEILKWWKTQLKARYLTKTDTIFEKAKQEIIDSPVLTVLNVMFIRSLKKLNIEFDTYAMNSLNLEKSMENKIILNILSAAPVLSANKIMQLVGLQNNYIFVDLDYVHILPDNEKNKFMNELSEVKALTLIIICETSLDEKHQNTINEIIKIYSRNLIIITDKQLEEKTYQNNDYIAFNDVNINLNDLNPNTQEKVLKECKVCYQGQEVPLNSIIGDGSQSLMHAKILWPILNKVKIEIGQPLDAFKYDEIRDYYVNRSLLREDKEYEVNTLNDIDDTIVLISSKPGMGKTILLTHLSLETKKIDPGPWIVRINMSAHTNDFAGWNLDVTHVMRFICKAALKTTTMDTIKKLNFTVSTEQTVDLNRDNLDDVPYELEWFIHFYNKGKIILLFDGFEKIYPRFTKEGIELLRILQQAKKRMWITSNCYTVHILEQELGASYELDTFSTKKQESFLNRFWKTNLKLEKLNHQQFNNISMFLNFFMKLFNSKNNVFSQTNRPMIPLLSVPLHIIYLSAVEYFKNEINSLSPSFLRETIKKKWRLNRYTSVDRYLRQDEEKSLELAGTPLHMYIAANYFKLQITDKFEIHLNKDLIINKSKVYLNAITSYELFLKNNIKHICEIENRNIEDEQEKVRDIFLQSHRKMALYAICKESDIPKLLTPIEIAEVKSMLKKVESGEIKSHLIDCVIDGIPQFYNLLFAEYFVAEFVSDMLKRVFHGDVNHLTLESLWNFVVNAMLTLCPPGVRNAFDYKLKYDPELAEAANNEKSDKILFELILKQNMKTKLAGRDTETCLNIAINEGLVNITNLLLRCVRRYVTNENVDGILSIIKSSAFVAGVANPSWKETTTEVMRCIDTVDGKELIAMVNSEEIEGVSQTLAALYENTDMGREIQQKIKKEVCEPVKEIVEKLVKTSEDNQNITTLMEVLPKHLPEIVDFIFHMNDPKTADEEEKGNSSRDTALEPFTGL